jgi:hypothetical protein
MVGAGGGRHKNEPRVRKPSTHKLEIHDQQVKTKDLEVGKFVWKIQLSKQLN